MLPAHKIESFREQLQHLADHHDGELSDLRREAAKGVGGESGGGISNAPLHQADLGTAHHEKEVDLLLVQNQESLLSECEAALSRIHAGTFGLCELCGDEIHSGRLEALPYARHCLDCASRVEVYAET